MPCSDRANCWVYTVRSGDNLFSIANYFGHSLNTIYTWNPQYPETALKVGAKIRMPAADPLSRRARALSRRRRDR